MKNCVQCGKPIDDAVVTCPYCGAAQQPGDAQQAGNAQQTGSAQQSAYMQQPAAQQPDPNDKGSVGWAILGFFIWIVGVILFFVWRKTKPKNAKMALIGGLIGLVINIICMLVHTMG
ncbi:MAG: zinc ribbon domain-containing protein [Anaerovoracaceae bacterium]|jgi:uncharacterized membrane protein YvbJ